MKTNFKIIMCFVVTLCLMCCSITVFAEPEFDFGDFTEAPIPTAENTTLPETTKDDNLIPSDYTTPGTTKAPTKAPSTTRKPSGGNSTATTRKPNNGNTNNKSTTNRWQAEPQNTQQKTTALAVDASLERVTFADALPEGYFHVFAEMNNGEDPLKLIMNRPSLIGDPGEPERKGFIFDGWYADPKFEKRWNFGTDIADEGTIIFAKWIPDPNAVVHSITVEQAEGGTISVNPDSASVGESVRITIKPDQGMRLVSGSLTINGKRIDVSNFKMPNEDVVIKVAFEVMPEIIEDEGNDKNIIPFVIGGVALVLIIILILVIVSRRRNVFSEDEIDENGTIIEDESDKSWVDDSIVVSDGFVGGEKVVGNTNSDADDSDFSSFGD